MSSKKNLTVFVDKGFTLINRGFRSELIRIPISCSGLLVARVEGISREHLTIKRKRQEFIKMPPSVIIRRFWGRGWGGVGRRREKR